MNRFYLLALGCALLLPFLLPPPNQSPPLAALSASAVADEGGENIDDQAPASLKEALERVSTSYTDAFEEETHCLAQAVYFEARSEPLEGQLAVAQVVLNRVKSPLWPDSICAVVFQNEHRRHGCQFSFACDGLSDNPTNMKAWNRAKMVSLVVLENLWQDMTDESTHYHADYVAPYWKDHMYPTVQYGRHHFYLDKRQLALMTATQPGD